MKKRILLIIITAIIIAGFGYYVFAGTDGDHGGDDSGAGTNIFNSHTNGVRLSFVDSKGNFIGGRNYVGLRSEDIGNQKNIHDNGQKFYITNNALSKVNYVVKGQEPNFSRLTDLKSYGSMYDFANIFDGLLDFKNDIVPMLTNNTAHTYYGRIVSSFNEVSGTDEEKQTKLKEVFNKMLADFGLSGKTIDDYAVDSYGDKNIKVYDLFLVIEPTKAVTVGKNDYYGSFYEIAKAFTQWSEQNEQFSFMANEFPCRLFLDGNLKEYLGISKNDKSAVAAFNPNLFNDSLYFGKIKVSNNDIKETNKVCKSSVKNVGFGDEKLISEIGIGMALVWPSKYIDETSDPLTCDSVINYYNNLPNPINLGEKTYDEILKFDFANWNNEKENFKRQVDSEWYIENNCPYKKASCDNINEFYGINGSLSCKEVEKMDFSKWNEENPNYKIDKEFYKKECGCDNSTYNCTPKFELGSCDQSDSKLYYTDTPKADMSLDDKEFWDNCVFEDKGYYDIDIHKYSDKSETYTFYDPDLRQYCTEKVDVSFPGSPEGSILAGSYFTWGNNNDVSIFGQRVCKSESIDLDDIESEVERHNKKMKEAYALLELEKAKKQEYDKLKQKPADYLYDDIFYCEGDNCEDATIANSDKKGNTDGYIIKGDNGLKGDLNKEFNIKWPALGNKVENKYSPKIDVNKAQAKYDNEEKATKIIKKKLEQPPLINLDSAIESFKFEPNIKIYYGDGEKYIDYQDKGIDMEHEEIVSSERLEDKNNVSDKSKTFHIIESCSNGKCKTVKFVGKEYSSQGVNIKKSWTYKLPDNIYRLVSKSSGLSIDYSDSALENGNYIDIGFPNFPVSFSAKSGTYGKKHGKGALSITYKNIGHLASDKTIFDAIGSNQNSEMYGNWDCEFNVTGIPNKIFDNVIYREIDLKNPFPGMDGNGRNTGANWCDSTDCSNTNSIVSEAILNNRGVSSNEVYKKEPIYSIVLTPKKLSQIKKYNKSHNYYDFSKDSIVCEVITDKDGNKTATGRACISSYLRSLGISGSCAGLNEGVTAEEFDKCRYEK